VYMRVRVSFMLTIKDTKQANLLSPRILFKLQGVVLWTH
jgi:hypothetical protein